MENPQRIAALACRAADILPGPPPADDREGYRAWEQLVLTTAARVGALAGVKGRAAVALGAPVRHRLDWHALLRLASVELPGGVLRPGL